MRVTTTHCPGLHRSQQAGCLSDLLLKTPKDWQSRSLLRFRCEDGLWQTWSWHKVQQGVLRVAAWLQAQGVEAGDRVGVLGHNSPAWLLSDLAILRLGAVTVPAYFTDAVERVSYVFEDSQCCLVLVQEGEQAEKVKACGEPYRCFSGEDSVMAVALDDQWDERLQAACPKRDDLATLIYTSGTTGTPKGVMLTHGNLLSDVWSGLGAVPVFEDDVFLSFLPLSHAFERTVGQFLPLACGATIAYAEDVTTLMRDMPEVQPTIMISVPRLYEKIYAGVRDKLDASLIKRMIFRQAQRLGRARFQALQAGGDLRGWQRFVWQVLDELAFQPLRQKLGGRLRLFISGGAALSPRIAEFLLSAGITVLPGYGLSEASPVLAVNTEDCIKPASVGRALPGVRCRLAEGDELCVQGDMVMQGYWQHPEWTQEVLDEDGWLHTGDVARMDDEGFIYIVERKKELIVLSNGENVPPALVEQHLCHLPWVAQAMVVGEGRPYLAALLVVDEARLQAWWQRKRRKKLPADWQDDMKVRAGLQKLIDRELSDLASYMQVKHWCVVGGAWTQDNGCLTPTLKLKRHMLAQRYAALIQELFDDESPSV